MNVAEHNGQIIVDFHAHIYPAKIADKVSNGAYFYSHFSVESDKTLFFDSIQKLLKKLTDKYSLHLTARQRTYRLNTKKEPIADLIIQKRPSIEGVNIFDFWLSESIITQVVKNLNLIVN